MKMYIVRHGQTAWNKIQRWQGNQEVPLDAIGMEQSHRLAEKLSLQPISKIYSSPLQRAVMSTSIMCEKINVDIVYRQELREVYLGEWEGFTTQEIIEKHGSLFDEWNKNPLAQVGLGVENLFDLQSRAFREFYKIAAHETGDCVIVAHGTWTRCLFCKLLSIPLESRMNFEISNAGISVIDCDNQHFTVTTLNDISHLVSPPPAI